MQGIADGANAAGTKVTFQDILGWNSYKETVGYRWPIVKSGVYAGMEDEMDGCSAFIATGSATEDGDIVIAHTTWTPYERARFFHVISDLNPIPETPSRIVKCQVAETAHDLFDLGRHEVAVLKTSFVWGPSGMKVSPAVLLEPVPEPVGRYLDISRFTHGDNAHLKCQKNNDNNCR